MKTSKGIGSGQLFPEDVQDWYETNHLWSKNALRLFDRKNAALGVSRPEHSAGCATNQ